MYNDVLFTLCIFQFTILLLDIYIFARTGRDIAGRSERILFRALIVTHMQYLVCNTLWTLHEYGWLVLQRNVLMVICTISLWSVTNCAASFFLLVVEMRKIMFFRSPSGRLIKQLPAFITTVLICLNPLTGLVFTLSEEGYFVHEALYLPVFALSAVYLVAVVVVAAGSAVRTRNIFRPYADIALCASILLIILYVAADGFMQKVSILPAPIFAVIMVIFVLMQESNINSDLQHHLCEHEKP